MNHTFVSFNTFIYTIKPKLLLRSSILELISEDYFETKKNK